MKRGNIVYRITEQYLFLFFDVLAVFLDGFEPFNNFLVVAATLMGGSGADIFCHPIVNFDAFRCPLSLAKSIYSKGLIGNIVNSPTVTIFYGV